MESSRSSFANALAAMQLSSQPAHVLQESVAEAGKDEEATHFFCYRPSRKTVIKFIYLLLYFVVGCIYYSHAEGWSISTSLSFAVVTMTTVGYGYHYPTTDNSRVFTMFYICFGVYFVFANLAFSLSKRIQRAGKYFQTVTDMDKLFSKYTFHKRTMIYNVLIMVATVLVGGAILTFLENWTLVQGVYFALETSTTVGYGDLNITNQRTHIFLGFYIIFSTILLSLAVQNYQMIKAEEKQMKTVSELRSRMKDLGFLANLDGGKGISEEQFVLAMLNHLGTIDFERDVRPWTEKFQELNPDQNGRVFRTTLHEYSMASSVRHSSIGDKASESSSSRFSSFLKSTFTLPTSLVSRQPTQQQELVPDAGNPLRSSLISSRREV